jgi:hypothetical protein
VFGTVRSVHENSGLRSGGLRIHGCPLKGGDRGETSEAR